MSLGKFQKKGMRYLNSLPNVVCKCNPPQGTRSFASYSWYLDDMEEYEYFARMSETQSSFVVLTHCSFYRIGNDNRMYTSGGRAVCKMQDLKIAVGKILKEIEEVRKCRADYLKERKTRAIMRAAGEYEA